MRIRWETENPTTAVHKIEEFGEEVGVLESRS